MVTQSVNRATKSRFDVQHAFHDSSDSYYAKPTSTVTPLTSEPKRQGPVLGITVKASKSGKSYQCPVPGCDDYLKYEDTTEPKMHLMSKHFPKALFSKCKDCKKQLDSLLVRLAKQCGMTTVQKGAKGQQDLIKQLLNFVQMNDTHKCYSGCEITEEEKRIVHFYHQHNQHGLPLKLVNVHQPNCIAALVWWKNILDLLVTLDPSSVDAVLEASADAKPKKSPKKDEHVKDEKPVVTRPFESRVYHDTTTPTATSEPVAQNEDDDVIIVKEIKSKQSKKEKKAAAAASGVTDGYCDFAALRDADFSEQLAQRCSIVAFESPTSYPDEAFFEESACGSQCYYTLGFDPAFQKTSTNPTLWKKIELAVSKYPRVVAVGAVGLDYSQSQASKQAQIVALTRMSTLAKERKLPLIVRCVESSHDLEANRDCIEVLRGILTRDHIVVKLSLASFQEAHIWYEAFPRTVFAIDSLALNDDVMTSSFTAFVGLLDMNNLLVTSGSGDGDGRAAVEVARDVCAKVGKLKNLSAKNVAHNQIILLRRIFKIII